MRTFVKILLLLFLLQLAPGFSQGDRDKVELLRVSFITKKLELSSSETEKFWPVYNEYNDKIKALRKNLRQSYRKKPEPLTEADAEELYQLELRTRQAEWDLHKQYSDKIKNIIGVKKCVRLRVAEEEFKRQMIQQIKDQSD
jgi:hypothetical protein